MLRIYRGDALTVLKTLPSESVHVCVTSPPYYLQREYGTAVWDGGRLDCDHIVGRVTRTITGKSEKQTTNTGSMASETKGVCAKCGARRIDKQIGREETPEKYVANLVLVFWELRRVLRSDGTLWVVIGDSYCGTSCKSKDQSSSTLGGGKATQLAATDMPNKTPPGYKPKDLMMIPAQFAIAMRVDGWWLRRDNVWGKVAPMPESCSDRCTTSHEYIFHFSKRATYFYDSEAIKEAGSANSHGGGSGKDDIYLIKSGRNDTNLIATPAGSVGHNKRSVWVIGPEPNRGLDHYAAYPTKLVEPCIKAGSSEHGCCPRCGSPWERIIERSVPGYPAAKRVEPYSHGGKNTCLNVSNSSNYRPKTHLVGWQPTCRCVECGDVDLGGDGVTNSYPIPVPCTVLDPFNGVGTTGLVAARLGRSYVGIELSGKYCEVSKRRIEQDAPLLNKVELIG